MPIPIQRCLASTPAACLLAAACLLGVTTAGAEKAWREYPSFEGADAAAPVPPDYLVPAELAIGRLMYPPAGGRGFFGGGDWRQGRASWTDDYPRGDRKLVQMIRTYTRTNVRSVEEPINLEDGDDVDNWPFMLMGLASPWDLTDEMANNLREYLLRGGFLFCDSFFREQDWLIFEQSLKKVFPDRPIIEMSDDHPIFHVVFDLPNMTKVQIPNANNLPRGYLGRPGDGDTPHWRGVEDDDGRLMMLIAFNNDVMDGWQWADDKRYPAEEANLSLRLGINVVVYAMTH
jgi:Domain of unknown function (DUF4159)